MKSGREFPSVTSGQLHSAVTLYSGRGRTRGVGLEKSLGSGSGPGNYRCISRRESVEECLPLLPPIDKDWNVGPRADSISVNKWDVPAEVKEYIMDRVLDHFDLDYTRQEDKRSEQNKKNRSKLTVGSRSFQRTRACMKNQESGEINPAELYKKNYTNKDGIWTSEGAREIYDAVKPPPSSTLTTQSSDLQHQLAKARDEIEAMRAAREKDLQEFAKKQAEMEATLRDHLRSSGWSRSASGWSRRSA
ncbi:hypothetical protein CJ030_MR5G001871 [Morella rubra]|uniref:Uncharacterized protein n=1 Tax=Morella rubra TaxID=262757 RepID=A0A6A1VJ68_9ROSI|nr:hypothetical protein CJ030_MR5G001871 [Morella rubra]